MINDSLDAHFGAPQRIARALIAFHQARGDTIVFVTSRPPSRPSSDRTSRLLHRWFSSAPPTALFTARRPETDAVRSVHPAIRLLRSPVSYNEPPPSPGRVGEEILADFAD